MITETKITFNILNEEIVGIDYIGFIGLIEDVLLKGFSEKGIDIEIKELHRNDKNQLMCERLFLKN